MKNIVIVTLIGLGANVFAQSFSYYPPIDYHQTWEREIYDNDGRRYGFLKDTPFGMYLLFSDTTVYDSTGTYSFNVYAEDLPKGMQAQFAWEVFEKMPADTTSYTALLKHPYHQWAELCANHGDETWFAEKSLGNRLARIFYWDSWEAFFIEVSEGSLYLND